MKLPPGATGFNAPPVDREAEARAFTAVCHHAARTVGGVVSAASHAGVTPNFHTVDIVRSEHPTAVLRHAALPPVAFARPRRPSDLTPTFVDAPDLAAAIGQASQLQILTAEQPDVPLSRADLSALSPHEHRQITYWRPATTDELMVNFWD